MKKMKKVVKQNKSKKKDNNFDKPISQKEVQDVKKIIYYLTMFCLFSSNTNINFRISEFIEFFEYIIEELKSLMVKSSNQAKFIEYFKICSDKLKDLYKEN